MRKFSKLHDFVCAGRINYVKSVVPCESSDIICNFTLRVQEEWTSTHSIWRSLSFTTGTKPMNTRKIPISQKMKIETR